MIETQIFLVGAGFVGLLWAMIAWMIRANRREREYMERRRQEWIADGSRPDEEPKFYSGTACGGG